MQRYSVEWTAQARDELQEVCAYIIEKSGFRDRAESYYIRVLDFADKLETAPHRGSQRDDLREGLRLIPFQRTALLAIVVNDENSTVTVTNFFYGGRDVDALLRSDMAT